MWNTRFQSLKRDNERSDLAHRRNVGVLIVFQSLKRDNERSDPASVRLRQGLRPGFNPSSGITSVLTSSLLGPTTPVTQFQSLKRDNERSDLKSRGWKLLKGKVSIPQAG